jgi:hypothetical protein
LLVWLEQDTESGDSSIAVPRHSKGSHLDGEGDRGTRDRRARLRDLRIADLDGDVGRWLGLKRLPNKLASGLAEGDAAGKIAIVDKNKKPVFWDEASFENWDLKKSSLWN